MSRYRHQHDCEKCIYIASMGSLDLYICSEHDNSTTYILRRSDESSDYASMSDFGNKVYNEMKASCLGNLKNHAYFIRKLVAIKLLPTAFTNEFVYLLSKEEGYNKTTKGF